MESRRGRNRSHVKMMGWRTWMCFKRSFLLPTKCFLLKLTSRSRNKAKGKFKFHTIQLHKTHTLSLSSLSTLFWDVAEIAGNGHGLVNLYKDMESCGEYEDIRVMWEIIHSSPQKTNSSNCRKRSSSHWRFCLQPTWILSFFLKQLALV